MYTLEKLSQFFIACIAKSHVCVNVLCVILISFCLYSNKNINFPLGITLIRVTSSYTYYEDNHLYACQIGNMFTITEIVWSYRYLYKGAKIY